MTNMNMWVNIVDPTITFASVPADYMEVDLLNDYLIWTAGSNIVEDGMTHEPTQTELTNASPLIDPVVAITVPLCLFMDYSHLGGIYTHEIQGMGDNKRYVFAFDFDNATATEPQLEAWDDSTLTTVAKNVLGAGTPANSMIKAVCTTGALPGDNWLGTAIAGNGSTRVVPLNAGLGGLVGAGTLYANIKIVIPANYPTPAIESFILAIRYSFI